MLVWACIAPHGGEVIPELAGDNLPRMAATRAAMQELGRRCEQAQPDSIVVFTPHGLCFDEHVCVSVAMRAEGMLDGENGARVCASIEVDIPLAQAISEAASQRGVPVAQAAYTDEGEPAPTFPLDWGALIPLWFMGARWRKPPAVVVVCPSRSIPRRKLVEFGRATVEAAVSVGRRVAVICSADQGHGHAADGPYGFSATSASYDRAYCQAVEEDALPRLLHWQDAWIESALPDSYWQTLMLYGALQTVPMEPELLSYEAPTYFGMACAEYRRVPG